jgi:hypothetical protein
MRAIPVGVIEVSDQPTRFAPIADRKGMAGAVLAGIVLGMFLGRAGGRCDRIGVPPPLDSPDDERV